MRSSSVPERPGWASVLLRSGIDRLLNLLADREVTGLEEVPRHGPCLVVFNQLSLLDTPLLSITLPRRDVTGLVARDYRTNPLYRVLVETGGGLWLRREASDHAALKGALDALRRGWAVGISPEGRRSPTGGLVRGKPGAALLALRSGAPVVPMAFTHTRDVLQSVRRLRRSRIGVRIGPAFQLVAREGRSRREELEEATDIIMRRLASLLPPDYRGVYADDAEAQDAPRSVDDARGREDPQPDPRGAT